MVDSELIESVIADSGLKKQSIADYMGLTPYGLQRKINGLSEFKASEIVKFCECLKITNLKIREAIFFTKKGD